MPSHKLCNLLLMLMVVAAAPLRLQPAEANDLSAPVMEATAGADSTAYQSNATVATSAAGLQTQNNTADAPKQDDGNKPKVAAQHHYGGWSNRRDSWYHTSGSQCSCPAGPQGPKGQKGDKGDPGTTQAGDVRSAFVLRPEVDYNVQEKVTVTAKCMEGFTALSCMCRSSDTEGSDTARNAAFFVQGFYLQDDKTCACEFRPATSDNRLAVVDAVVLTALVRCMRI